MALMTAIAKTAGSIDVIVATTAVPGTAAPPNTAPPVPAAPPAAPAPPPVITVCRTEGAAPIKPRRLENRALGEGDGAGRGMPCARNIVLRRRKCTLKWNLLSLNYRLWTHTSYSIESG